MTDLIIESLASHLESRGFLILEVTKEHVVVGGGFMLYRYGLGLHTHMFGIGRCYDYRWSPGQLVALTNRPGVSFWSPVIIDLDGPTALDQVETSLRSGRRPWQWVQRLIHGFQRWSRSLSGI